MRGPALVGHAPRELHWSSDGAELRFSWAKADGTPDPEYKEFIVKRDGTGLAPSGSRPFTEATIEMPSTAEGKSVYLSDGDIFLRDPATKTPQRLTHTTDAKDDPKLALGGSAVVYVQGGNLFRLNVADGKTAKLTDIKTSDEAPISDTGSETALAAEETELFKVFPPSGRSQTAARRGAGGGRTRSYSLSPNGTYAAISLQQVAVAGKPADVPNYVTRSGYPEMISGYEKVGERQSHSRLMVVDIKTGQNISIAGDRPGRISTLRWSPDGGKHAVALATAEDHKDSWLLGFDPNTDKVTVLWNEHDEARGLVGQDVASLVGYQTARESTSNRKRTDMRT